MALSRRQPRTLDVNNAATAVAKSRLLGSRRMCNLYSLTKNGALGWQLS
jgi:hypothetical protein